MARSKKTFKKRKHTKFVWTKELIFLIIGLAVCIGLMIFCLIPSRAQRFYNKWYTDDNDLQLDNVFYEVNYNKLKKQIETGELTYVYYATENDDTCLTDLGILDHYTNKYEDSNDDSHYDIDQIYVYNAKEAYKFSEKDDDDWLYDYYEDKLDAKEDYFNSILGSGIDEISLDSYAQLWIFDEGELVFSSETLLSDQQASDEGADFTIAAIKYLSYTLTSDDADASWTSASES